MRIDMWDPDYPEDVKNAEATLPPIRPEVPYIRPLWQSWGLAVLWRRGWVI